MNSSSSHNYSLIQPESESKSESESGSGSGSEYSNFQLPLPLPTENVGYIRWCTMAKAYESFLHCPSLINFITETSEDFFNLVIQDINHPLYQQQTDNSGRICYMGYRYRDVAFEKEKLRASAKSSIQSK